MSLKQKRQYLRLGLLPCCTALLLLLIYPCEMETVLADEQKTETHPLSQKELTAIWEAIKSTKAADIKQTQFPDVDFKIEPGSDNYWGLFTALGFDELKKISQSSNPRKGFQYFVDQFGTTDALTDMRWLQAARALHLNPERSYHPLREPENKYQQRQRRDQLIFAELMVRKFLKSPEALKRYYQAVIWFDRMLHPLNFPVYQGVISRQLKKESPEDGYWWHAFQFVLMAHATGRDDLLEDVKPEDLKPRFNKWFNWYKENGLKLWADEETWYWEKNTDENNKLYLNLKFLDDQGLPPLKVRPQYPFPNWKGPEPAAPKLYRGVE